MCILKIIKRYYKNYKFYVKNKQFIKFTTFKKLFSKIYKKKNHENLKSFKKL